MKKLVIATAVLGAFAGAAQAQSDVTIYGIVDGNVRFDKTDIGTLNSVGGGGASGSRWGLKGSEDLGNGLKANFVLEQGFDISDNSVPQGQITSSTLTGGNSAANSGPRVFSRTATVGLSGAFGSIRLGRAYNPFYTIWGAADPFGQGTVGQLGQFDGVTVRTNAVNSTNPGESLASAASGIRFDNGIYYDTPNFNGFQGALAYSFGENKVSDPSSLTSARTDKNGSSQYNLGLTYSNGPVYIGYSYLNTNNASDNNELKRNTLVGTYDFGKVKLHGLYWTQKDDATGTTTANFGTASVPRNRDLNNKTDNRTYAIGLTIPLHAWTIKAGYTHRDDRSNDFDANFYSLGLNYAFSKRTDIYTAVSKMNNKNDSNYLISDASNTGLQTTTNVPVGYSPTAFQVGVRHMF